jgi:hypothetical protein
MKYVYALYIYMYMYNTGLGYSEMKSATCRVVLCPFSKHTAKYFQREAGYKSATRKKRCAFRVETLAEKRHADAVW